MKLASVELVSFILTGCKPEQQMMYAGSKNRLVQAAELTKVIVTKFGPYFIMKLNDPLNYART